MNHTRTCLLAALAIAIAIPANNAQASTPTNTSPPTLTVQANVNPGCDRTTDANLVSNAETNVTPSSIPRVNKAAAHFTNSVAEWAKGSPTTVGTNVAAAPKFPANAAGFDTVFTISNTAPANAIANASPPTNNVAGITRANNGANLETGAPLDDTPLMTTAEANSIAKNCSLVTANTN